MIQLLSHKMKNPKSAGEYRPESDDLTCSKNTKELGGYLEKHPNNGMPFGFPPLKQDEFDIIVGWLDQNPAAYDKEALEDMESTNVTNAKVFGM